MNVLINRAVYGAVARPQEPCDAIYALSCRQLRVLKDDKQDKVGSASHARTATSKW